jgi:hypothetical protein
MEVERLSPDEIDRLRRLAKREHGWLWECARMCVLNGVVLGLMLYVPVFAIWKWLSPWYDAQIDQGPFILLAWVLGAAVLAIAVLPAELRGMSKQKKEAQAFLADAANGFAHVTRLRVQRVVEIVEYEDEGAGFLLEMPDSKVLCLISQDLYDFVEDTSLEDGVPDRRGEFPQDRIMLRVAPQSGWLLDIKGCGQSLRPFAKVRTSRRQFVKDKATGKTSYIGPVDMTTCDGPVDALLAQWRYKLEPLN